MLNRIIALDNAYESQTFKGLYKQKTVSWYIWEDYLENTEDVWHSPIEKALIPIPCAVKTLNRLLLMPKIITSCVICFLGT